MHPVESTPTPPPLPAERLQPDSWFHQYSNAYPRMDDQQYGGRPQAEPQHEPDAGTIAQHQPRRVMP